MSNTVSCPLSQDNPEFDSTLKFIGMDPDNKIVIFFSICVVVRLLIAGIAQQYYDKKYFPYIAAILAIITLIILIPRAVRNDNVWWFRIFHVFIAIQILISSIRQIKNDTLEHVIPTLLYLDVIFGMFTFLFAYMYC